MGKCFITKLPSSLKPNPNLRTFNSIRLIEVSPLAQGVEPSYTDSAVVDFAHVLKFKSYDKDGNLVYENKSAGDGMQPANVKYIELLDKDKTYGVSFIGTRFQYEDSLSTLCKLKNLKYLSNLSKNNVDCTLSEVSTLTNLTLLDLWHTRVTGDISSLSTLTNLTQINLANTAITGNISSLSTLTNLTLLDLANTAITGNISSLSTLTNLTQIYIRNTAITGDISLLSTLTNLTLLDLANTAITGNISSLSTLTNLTLLDLWHTRVTGDISSLSTLTNLESLSVANTSVTGDISNLIDKLTKLKKLNISSTVTITDAQKKTLTDRGCTITIE